MVDRNWSCEGRQTGRLGRQARRDEEVYLAAFQNRQFLGAPESHSSYITLVARTTGDTAALTQALKDTLWSFDRNLPISQVLTMDAVVADANAQPPL